MEIVGTIIFREGVFLFVKPKTGICDAVGDPADQAAEIHGIGEVLRGIVIRKDDVFKPPGAVGSPQADNSAAKVKDPGGGFMGVSEGVKGDFTPVWGLKEGCFFYSIHAVNCIPIKL